jgi:hypothetical protein
VIEHILTNHECVFTDTGPATGIPMNVPVSDQDAVIIASHICNSANVWQAAVLLDDDDSNLAVSLEVWNRMDQFGCPLSIVSFDARGNVASMTPVVLGH